MREEVLICGEAGQLVGVLSTPEVQPGEEAAPTVIMLNAGLLHRVGPNRIYVMIARALAAMGFPVLRLDLAGIGESAPRAETMPQLEGVLSDVRTAMNTLGQRRGATRFILLGHCSGGIISLLVAEQEPRVVGVVMINPEGVNPEWDQLDKQRKLANYYSNFYGRDALGNRERLRRFLTGKADYRTIVNNLFRHVLWNRLAALVFRTRAMLGRRAAVAEGESAERQQARALLRLVSGRGTSLCFIFTDGSTGYEYVRAIAGAEIDRLCAAGAAQVKVIRDADHLFNLLASQQSLVAVITDWAQGLVPQAQAR
jgi:pimeloyl-ACP methyl ester carboxylesterase